MSESGIRRVAEANINNGMVVTIPAPANKISAVVPVWRNAPVPFKSEI